MGLQHLFSTLCKKGALCYTDISGSLVCSGLVIFQYIVIKEINVIPVRYKLSTLQFFFKLVTLFDFVLQSITVYANMSFQQLNDKCL